MVSGAQIRRIRKALGWSQSELARAMHVHVETVARWERRAQAPSPLAVINLRRVLMVPTVAAALSVALQEEVRGLEGADTGAG